MIPDPLTPTNCGGIIIGRGCDMKLMPAVALVCLIAGAIVPTDSAADKARRRAVGPEPMSITYMRWGCQIYGFDPVRIDRTASWLHTHESDRPSIVWPHMFEQGRLFRHNQPLLAWLLKNECATPIELQTLGTEYARKLGLATGDLLWFSTELDKAYGPNGW